MEEKDISYYWKQADLAVSFLKMRLCHTIFQRLRSTGDWYQSITRRNQRTKDAFPPKNCVTEIWCNSDEIAHRKRQAQTSACNFKPSKLFNCYFYSKFLAAICPYLFKAIASQQAVEKKTTMENIQEILSKVFAQAISLAFPDLPDVPIVITTSSSPKFGDYQCNSAMPISNMYKQQGNKAFVRLAFF